VNTAPQARSRGRGDLPQPVRVGEAVRGRAQKLRAPSPPRRPRLAGHRQPAAVDPELGPPRVAVA
jgi:hypothetical protein